MNENPYASPRAYNERRPIDWDLLFRAWFNVGLFCGKAACFVMACAWIARGWGFYSPRLIDAIVMPLGAMCLSAGIPAAVAVFTGRVKADA